MNLNFNIPGVSDLLAALNRLWGALQGSFSGSRAQPTPRANPTGSMGGGLPTMLGSLLGNTSRSPVRLWLRIIGAAIRAFQTGSAYAVGAFASIAAGAGAVGAAFFALSVIAVGLGKAFKFAIAEGLAFSDRQAESVASPKLQAVLDNIAVALGVPKEEISSVAGNQPGYAQGFINQLKFLYSMPKMPVEEYGRILKSMGLPTKLAKLFTLPDSELKDIFSTKRTKMNPSDSQDAEELMVEWRQFKEEGARLLREAGFTVLVFLKNLKDLFVGLKDSLYNTLTGLPFVGKNIKRLLDMNHEAGRNAVWDMLPKINPIMDLFKRHKKPQEDVMREVANKLDRAGDKLGRAADALAYTNKSGIFGGIDVVRANRAFPTNYAWTWNELRKRQMDDQVYLGAFTI